jgi:N-acetylmuramoyl-L-alanine amidase
MNSDSRKILNVALLVTSLSLITVHNIKAGTMALNARLNIENQAPAVAVSEIKATVPSPVVLKTIKKVEQAPKKEVKARQGKVYPKHKIVASRGGQVATQREVLARVIESEAGGEPLESAKAVASVIINRLDSGRYGSTVDGVVFASGQFPGAWNNNYYKQPSQRSYSIADWALSGGRNVPSDVQYYYNPSHTSKNNWIRSRVTYKVIGNHAFCWRWSVKETKKK